MGIGQNHQLSRPETTTKIQISKMSFLKNIQIYQKNTRGIFMTLQNIYDGAFSRELYPQKRSILDVW